MPEPAEVLAQSAANQIEQLINTIGWRLLDPTTPEEIKQYAASRLQALLDFLRRAAA